MGSHGPRQPRGDLALQRGVLPTRTGDGAGQVDSPASFFYPLDVVDGWNRLYGARGFVQYQFVVPLGAEDTVRRALERLSDAGCRPSSRCSSAWATSRGCSRSPCAGGRSHWTFPLGSTDSGRCSDGLDELVAESGGRVYLAKDSRLRPDVLETMYPRLSEWREIQSRLDPKGIMQSDLSRRLGVTA